MSEQGDLFGDVEVKKRYKVRRTLSPETRRRISESLKGHRHTSETRKKLADQKMLMPQEERSAWRQKLAQTARARGENHNWYVDGKGAERAAERGQQYTTQALKNWRKAVYERDDYTCQKCGVRGVRLNAHHIKDWRNHPESRYDIDNGQALCVPCHRGTPDFSGKNRQTPAPKTHCPHGHALTEDNIIRKPGKRRDRIRCRTCQNEGLKRNYRKKNPIESVRPRHGTETHCPRGHAYEGDNLIVNKKGSRVCRTCKNEKAKNYSIERRKSAGLSILEPVGAV